MKVFDETVCALGEGPLWHPERKQLFWFDIRGKRLITRVGANAQIWNFDEHVSAAGWIDNDSLLLASETALFRFDILTGERDMVHGLEADNSATRSNDGRADPWGGFWIGTMGKSGEAKAGSIYRYYKGELRRLYPDISVSNAICFTPDRSHGYFADTRARTIWKQRLDEAEGWPNGEPEVFVDLTSEGLNPDGAVVDTEGRLWNAQWGAGRIACYLPRGEFVSAVECPASQTTCPAFGGENLQSLFVTSAANALSADQLGNQPEAGKTFVVELEVQGQEEPRVLL